MDLYLHRPKTLNVTAVDVNVTHLHGLAVNIEWLGCNSASAAAADDIDGGQLLTVAAKSPRASRNLSLCVEIGCIGVLCLFGFVGNALSFAVLSHDVRNTTSWLLRSLTVLDIAYLAISVFVHPLNAIHHQTDWMSDAFGLLLTKLEPYTKAAYSTAHTATVWTVVIVTVDRYVAVCRPLDSQLRSLIRAKIVFGVVILAAVLYNVPLLFEFKGAITSVHRCHGLEYLQTVKTEIGENFLYFVVYKVASFCVLRVFVPMAVLIVCNVQLMATLFRRQQRYQWKQQQHRRERQQTNLTLTLVVVVSVFILSEAPALCLRLSLLYMDAQAMIGQRTETPSVEPWQYETAIKFMDVQTVTDAMMAFSSAVNFAIYCLIGKRFQTILLDMFGRRHRSSGTASTLVNSGGGNRMCAVQMNRSQRQQAQRGTNNEVEAQGQQRQKEEEDEMPSPRDGQILKLETLAVVETVPMREP